MTGPAHPARRRRRRVVLAILYWSAVVLVSLAVAVGFIAFLVSRDEASLDAPTKAPGAASQVGRPSVGE